MPVASAFTPLTFLFISIFGLVGVLARYSVGYAFARYVTATQFPFATFAINIVGSFIIGIVYVLGTEKGIAPSEVSLGIMVGLLGGFTTFSSFSLETLLLVESGRYLSAAVYLVSSPLLGLAAAFIGAKICRLAF